MNETEFIPLCLEWHVVDKNNETLDAFDNKEDADKFMKEHPESRIVVVQVGLSVFSCD